MGKVDVDEALNRKISPLYHVDKIKSPLMIAQGAHDPRVPQAESDQMFRAMLTRGLDVSYVLYTDEGHGIDKNDNRQDYYYRCACFLTVFLSRCCLLLTPQGPNTGDTYALRQAVLCLRACAGAEIC